MAFDGLFSSTSSLLLTLTVPKNRRVGRHRTGSPGLLLKLSSQSSSSVLRFSDPIHLSIRKALTTTQIFDLNNIPLVSGTSYVKWHLPSSTSAEHRGRTSREMIREHKAVWQYSKTLPVRLTIDRNGMLQESNIHFEVMQEYSSARAERIILGNLRLNLAEYVDAGEDGYGGVTRRYLMQDSRINSTLNVGISMHQIEGDRNFSSPPLRSAPVFVGIAGIMAAETAGSQGGEDSGHMPSMSSKTREQGKVQDMYRRTLAASWAAQEGELPADECIEDIFAGGDGWGGTGKGGKKAAKPSGASSDGEESEADRRTLKAYHIRNPSGSHAKYSSNKAKGHVRTSSRSNTGSDVSGVTGRASIEQQVQSSSSDTPADNWRRADELDEFTAREDLRSWEIAAPS